MKQAIVSPLDQYGEGEDMNWIGYLVAQFEDNGVSMEKIERAVGKAKMVVDEDEEVDDDACIENVFNALTGIGCTDIEVRVAGGLTWMNLP